MHHQILIKQMHYYPETCLCHSTCLFFNLFTVQPEINITLNAETINGTHYQSVSCSAINGRPEPQISWLVNGYPPSDFPFIEVVNNTLPSNDTFTVSSVLRFPTHLQEEDKVTCVVEHLTLPQPAVTTVRVETYSKNIKVVVFLCPCC